MAVPVAAAAAGGGLFMQAYRAAHAQLPSFMNLDPSGRYGSPHGAALRIALLGDSTLTGPGLDHPRDIWVARIAASLDTPVVLDLFGFGGSRVRDVLVQQLPALHDRGADLVILAVGSNDAIHGTSAGAFARDMRCLLRELSALDAEVLTLGLGDMSVIPRVPRSLRSLLALRSRIFDRAHARVVKGIEGVTRVPAGELTNHIFHERGAALFSPDQFHPNADGHDVWARACRPFVASAITRATDRRALAS